MFLDDKLYKICSEMVVKPNFNIQHLNKTLLIECENYYKPIIANNKTNKECKVILDRTFNHWNSFVRMLKNSNDKNINILGTLFSEHTFKKQFLSNKELAELYSKL